MSQDAIADFTTPVGRLVQGSVSVGKETDMENRPLTYSTGPKAGQPRKDYFFALAIRKDDPGLPAFMQTIMGKARADFPHLFDANGNCQFPGFAWKFKDGDDTTVDANGRSNAQREGFPGCYVFSFSGSTAPKLYKMVQGRAVEIMDPEEIKKGYYVQVYGSTKGNGQQQKPGMYMNHNYVCLVAQGEVIQSGPEANAVFNTPAALPQGATPLGAAPAAAITPMGAGTQMPQPGFTAPPAGVPAQPPQQIAGAPVGQVAQVSPVSAPAQTPVPGMPTPGAIPQITGVQQAAPAAAPVASMPTQSPSNVGIPGVQPGANFLNPQG